MSWEEARDVAKHPVVGGTIPTTEGHSPRSQQCQGIDTDSQGPPPRLSQVPGALLISGSLLQILELGRLGEHGRFTEEEVSWGPWAVGCGPGCSPHHCPPPHPRPACAPQQLQLRGAKGWRPGWAGGSGASGPPPQTLHPGTQQLEGGVAFPGGAEQSHTGKRGAPNPARGRHSQGRISVQNVTFPGFFHWSGGSRLGSDGRRRSGVRGVSSGVTW